MAEYKKKTVKKSTPPKVKKTGKKLDSFSTVKKDKEKKSKPAEVPMKPKKERVKTETKAPKAPRQRKKLKMPQLGGMRLLLGKKGEIHEVSDGYARNFILPKKVGIEANGSNMNDLKLQKANQEKVAKENLDAAKAFAKDLETKEVVLTMKAGEGGRVFGSVSSKEIAQAFKEQCGVEVDKKKIVLTDAIKTFGTFEVKVKLHPQVTGTLKVKVKEQ